MIGPTYQFPEERIQHPSADSIYTSAMTGLYGWTSLGMLLAGITGWALHMMETYLISSLETFILTFILALGLLLASDFTARRSDIPIVAPAILYLAFTTVEGAILAVIFAHFSLSTITTAFGGAVLVFVVMTIYGLRTRRDLSDFGQLAMMGLYGVIIMGLLNIFILHSDGLRFIISVITIPIFMGLIAWETREIKREAQKAAGYCDPQAANRIALIGAAGMFLNIMNIFIALLNILSLDFTGSGDK